MLDNKEYTGILRPWTTQYNPSCYIKGDRLFLFDDKGNKYLDLTSGSFNVCLGYSNVKIISKLVSQLKDLPYLDPNYSNPTRTNFTNALLKLTEGNFDKVYIASGGSEAIELAIRIALYTSSYEVIVCFSKCYHGSIGIASKASHNDNLITSPNIKYISPPNCFKCQFNNCPKECNIECFSEVERLIQKYSGQIAAFLIEPFIGVNLYLPIANKYLEKLSKTLNDNNILLIYDEILCGFYRTGKVFMYKYSNIVPDILCCGKSITSGYAPIGLTLVNKKIAIELQDKNIDFGATYTANLNACAAAIATIKEINESFEKEIVKKSDYIKKKLEVLGKKMSSIIFNIKGLGLLYGIELFWKKEDRCFNQFEMNLIINLLKQNGIIVFPDNTVSILPLAPPYIITFEELDNLFEKLELSLKQMKISKITNSNFAIK